MTIGKDMQIIPARLFLFNKPELGVQQITPYAAVRFHLTQTLTGDATDEYPGLPKVGPVKASEILGTDSAEPEDLWRRVVAAYEHRGFSEDEALVEGTAHLHFYSMGDFPRFGRHPVALD